MLRVVDAGTLQGRGGGLFVTGGEEDRAMVTRGGSAQFDVDATASERLAHVGQLTWLVLQFDGVDVHDGPPWSQPGSRQLIRYAGHTRCLLGLRSAVTHTQRRRD